MKVGFISLGCSKNLIDTEVAIGKFKDHKFEIVNNPAEADMIVINTCGFIESAKQEAIDTILEMAQYKNRKCKYLVVMGCLVQRYYDDLIKLLPEVDLFIKIEDYNNLWEKVEELTRMETSQTGPSQNGPVPNRPGNVPNWSEKTTNVYGARIFTKDSVNRKKLCIFKNWRRM